MVELEVRWGDGACRQWALRGGQRAVSVHAYSVDASIWKAARFPPTPPTRPHMLIAMSPLPPTPRRISISFVDYEFVVFFAQLYKLVRHGGLCGSCCVLSNHSHI